GASCARGCATWMPSSGGWSPGWPGGPPSCWAPWSCRCCRWWGRERPSPWGWPWGPGWPPVCATFVAAPCRCPMAADHRAGRPRR
ncbi:MAG: hypothetical protein ACK56I_36565, partial [bacterium]